MRYDASVDTDAPNQSLKLSVNGLNTTDINMLEVTLLLGESEIFFLSFHLLCIKKHVKFPGIQVEGTWVSHSLSVNALKVVNLYFDWPVKRTSSIASHIETFDPEFISGERDPSTSPKRTLCYHLSLMADPRFSWGGGSPACINIRFCQNFPSWGRGGPRHVLT